MTFPMEKTLRASIARETGGTGLRPNEAKRAPEGPSTDQRLRDVRRELERIDHALRELSVKYRAPLARRREHLLEDERRLLAERALRDRTERDERERLLTRMRAAWSALVSHIMSMGEGRVVLEETWAIQLAELRDRYDAAVIELAESVR